MAIDVDAEDLHPLNQPKKWWPAIEDREPPSFPSANRWRVTGILAKNGERVKLESVMLAGRRYTSTEAARRFIAALNAADQQPPTDAETADTVASNGKAAARALSAMGI